MDREEVLAEFLKGLRIAISSASAYPKEHPYFLKTAEEFKARIEAFFPFLNPIKMNIGPDFLLIAGEKLEKAALYVDLANAFHLRKIKSLEFKPGLTIEETASFLDAVARPIKDILKDGGVSVALSGQSQSHIIAEELDYSGLLRAEGAESQDVWLDIFAGVISREDEVKINEFAQNFGQIIKNFKSEDILKNKNLKDNLGKFLAYLKEKDNEKYLVCAAELLGVLYRSKVAPDTSDLVEVEGFFAGLDKDSVARLAETNPLAAERIKEVLTVSEDSLILPFYRHALSSIAKEDIVKDASLSFDRTQTDFNFRYIILNLAKDETDHDKLKEICSRLAKLCEKALADKDSSYLKLTIEVIEERCKALPDLVVEFATIEDVIAGFCEAAIFEADMPEELAQLAGRIKASSLGFDYYMKQIFENGLVNPRLMYYFLRFFPAEIQYFYQALKQKQADMDFLFRIIKGLEGSGSALASSVLANIFSFSNSIIKAEALRALKNLPQESRALVINSVLSEFFNISSPLGFKNDILIQRLAVVEELNLSEARDLVDALSKRPFFWNRRLRVRAKEVLTKI
jgi:hypothetical protein